ncbi:TetR/AcrR family transcriptional regulator [Gordonia desulfuricans]|uniref:TetR/AcrR family transcriptional regulator n=1 Tax=Gordonia desulfuricans TaxID=89051 RepID=A0A7K3LLQ6_9ACTN|nr:TetR family transcriptional regulator [Gordonia desulfuricans]NDK89185.1 TetR/AcrR family transcriptional regulator [Gordonia desulfuricans]
MDRDRMVDVGVGLVSRFGAKALSLTSVARHAGVARATAYRMFGGRDALVAAIVDREVATLRVLLREWAAPEPDAAGKIRAQIRNVLPYIREHEALQYVLRKEPEEIVRALVTTDQTEGPSLVSRIVDQALPDLEPAIGEQLVPDPRAAAEFLVRMIFSVMLEPESSLTDDQIADLVVRAIVRTGPDAAGHE